MLKLFWYNYPFPSVLNELLNKNKVFWLNLCLTHWGATEPKSLLYCFKINLFILVFFLFYANFIAEVQVTPGSQICYTREVCQTKFNKINLKYTIKFLKNSLASERRTTWNNAQKHRDILCKEKYVDTIPMTLCGAHASTALWHLW